MALFDDVKLALRVSADAYDDEIDGLIASARLDLSTSGIAVAVANAEPPDALIQTAITLYCKAGFGLDNADSEKYQMSYQSVLHKLCLVPEYQEQAVS